MVSIEILVVEENAILIKGLRDASESRKIAADVEAEVKARAMEELSENNFFVRAMEEIINDINWNVKQGRTSSNSTGYGDRSSSLRSYDPQLIEAMEVILKKNIAPILRAKGYCCTVSRHFFATTEQYFTVKVSW